eukprot:symbB.v1.2.028174.t1/scaffold2961.1/size66437/6
MLKHSISQTRTCIGNKLRNGTKIQAGIGCVSSAAFCAEMVYEVLGFDILILDCNEHEGTMCAKLVAAFANEQEQPKARTAQESSLLA